MPTYSPPFPARSTWFMIGPEAQFGDEPTNWIYGGWIGRTDVPNFRMLRNLQAQRTAGTSTVISWNPGLLAPTCRVRFEVLPSFGTVAGSGGGYEYGMLQVTSDPTDTYGPWDFPPPIYSSWSLAMGGYANWPGESTQYPWRLRWKGCVADGATFSWMEGRPLICDLSFAASMADYGAFTFDSSIYPNILQMPLMFNEASIWDIASGYGSFFGLAGYEWLVPRGSITIRREVHRAYGSGGAWPKLAPNAPWSINVLTQDVSCDFGLYAPWMDPDLNSYLPRVLDGMTVRFVDANSGDAMNIVMRRVASNNSDAGPATAGQVVPFSTSLVAGDVGFVSTYA